MLAVGVVVLGGARVPIIRGTVDIGTMDIIIVHTTTDLAV